ncbi:MAG: hypothetical protein JWN26_587 [Candidatus Saccharibacteria bacterium]|nr:hypothetical protein [Candidatus Saccharibacteria bacterium]
MSHGPESHHSHEAEEEPERIPIADPRVRGRYRSIDKEYTTTHRGPNGEFYQIKNTSSTQADNRLYTEFQRSLKLRDPLANELYRVTENGIPMRPAKSSDEFLETVTEAGVEDNLGNYDLGSVKDANENLDTDEKRFVKGPLSGFISYGMGENHSNQREAISERSASITLSNEARKKAIDEGKTFEEAQEIGARVYREQEQFKADFKRGTFNQPEAEASSVSKPVPVYEALGSTPPPDLKDAWVGEQSRKRKFGRTATGDSWFRFPPPPQTPPPPEPSEPEHEEQSDDVSTFLYNARRDKKYSNSTWIRDISNSDMTRIMDEVHQLRNTLVSEGVIDKATQDRRIYRSVRLQLETDGVVDDTLKQTQGVLWDFMGGSPKGEIPF